MILHIDDSMTVGDIQDKFSLCFPALTIKFYLEPHGYKETSSPDLEIDSKALLSTIRKSHGAENLTILSTDKVSKVEYNFKKLFGLNVQVFRKENGVWLQTSFTDKYSLKELSEYSSRSIY